MKLNEKHHAAIVLAFYRALRDEYGETGLLAFSMAQRLYGEQRGRCMALRALRDGHKLGYTEYFAYSEWECTPEFFDVTMDARPGLSLIHIWYRCPESRRDRRLFRSRGAGGHGPDLWNESISGFAYRHGQRRAQPWYLRQQGDVKAGNGRRYPDT